MRHADAAAEPEVRVYSSARDSGWGWTVWRGMFAEQARARELTWRLFVRDFSARYRQTVLGVLWAAVVPVLATATFVVMNASGTLRVGDVGVPYAVYVLLGFAVWQIFAGGIVACSNSIVTGGAMVVKINFPKETLVVAAMGQVGVDVLVRLGLLGILLVWYGVVPSWAAVLFPLAVLPLFAFTLGLGLVLSFANAVLRDIGQMVAVATTFLMLLTPVAYPVPESGALADLMRWNPLTPLVLAPRELFLFGELSDARGFAIAALGSLLVLAVGWRVFHLVEPRVAERV